MRMSKEQRNVESGTMATTNQANREATISSDALGLLDCFSGGVGELVYKPAEHAALSREGPEAKSVEVSADDVEKAADFLVQIIRNSNVPTQVKPAVDSMLQCFSHKNTQRKR
jgi:hypothetical protein